MSLRITGQFGYTDEKIGSQYVHLVTPVAAFSMSDSISTCPPLIVQFTNQFANQDSWRWHFGDGSFSSEASPSHFYNLPGLYFPKLTITGPAVVSP